MSPADPRRATRRRDQLARAVRLRGRERGLRDEPTTAPYMRAAARAARAAGEAGRRVSRWCSKLLAFNADGVKRVEVVILSRNDPVSGLARVPIGEGRRPRHRARRVHARARAVRLPRAAQREPVPVGQRRRRARGAQRRVSGGDGLHAVGGDATRIPTKCASRSTATPCCSRTKPSASTATGASTRSRRTRPTTRRVRCRPVRSSRCSRRCTGCSRPIDRGKVPMRLRTALVTARSAPGARARDPHADGLEHPRRRGDVPGRPRQGRRSCASSSPTSSSTTRRGTSSRRRSTCRRATCCTASPTKPKATKR